MTSTNAIEATDRIIAAADSMAQTCFEAAAAIGQLQAQSDARLAQWAREDAIWKNLEALHTPCKCGHTVASHSDFHGACYGVDCRCNGYTKE